MSEPIRTISYGDEYMELYADGTIGRPAIGMKPSGAWKITGAVTLDRFGRQVATYTLAEILAHADTIPWLHKNGKQKTHVIDLDHGTRRQWCSPTHHIY